MIYPKYELSPSFCPLHGIPAPCLHCLSPEVAELASRYHKDLELDFQGFLFVQADLNQN